jgi:uncharacterized membrane protein
MEQPMSLDLALIVFDTDDGAERAYGDIRPRAGDQPWVDEVAFVVRHRDGRIEMRGTLAGHWVYVDDVGDVLGREVPVGALTGALVGALLGPPGFAVGLVGGAALAGYHEAREHAPDLHGELFDTLRRELPEGSSAVVLLAAPEHVDAMVAAFDDSGGRVVRRSLSDEEASALLGSLASAPPVPASRRR